MLLADQGAEVLRIARPGAVPLVPHDLSLRNRATVWRSTCAGPRPLPRC